MAASRSVADVYDALAPAVLGYLRSQGAADAEATTGDVFVAVAESLGGFRGDDDALRRWVFSIAHNRLIDERRRRTVVREESVAEVPDLPTVDAVGSLDEDLAAAISRLTDDQRDVILLRYVADLSVRETARLTGKRQGAVKQLQLRALRNLEKALREPDGQRDHGNLERTGESDGHP